jgi:cyclic pyranopterin phosphate synthase
MPKLSHLDAQGRARMVDVAEKPLTARRAVARGRVRFSRDAYDTVRRDGSAKGDILRVAELAGVMGGKRTSELIPLCHPLPLDAINVAAKYSDDSAVIEITADVRTTGRTGVEMEALTAVSIACLAVYDMTKSVDKAMTIEAIELVEKSGGASDDFRRR